MPWLPRLCVPTIAPVVVSAILRGACATLASTGRTAVKLCPLAMLLLIAQGTGSVWIMYVYVIQDSTATTAAHRVLTGRLGHLDAIEIGTMVDASTARVRVCLNIQANGVRLTWMSFWNRMLMAENRLGGSCWQFQL